MQRGGKRGEVTNRKGGKAIERQEGQGKEEGQGFVGEAAMDVRDCEEGCPACECLLTQQYFG